MKESYREKEKIKTNDECMLTFMYHRFNALMIYPSIHMKKYDSGCYVIAFIDNNWW